VKKYSTLERTHFFQPIAVEPLDPTNFVAYSFLTELGRKISEVSDVRTAAVSAVIYKW